MYRNVWTMYAKNGVNCICVDDATIECKFDIQHNCRT